MTDALANTSKFRKGIFGGYLGNFIGYSPPRFPFTVSGVRAKWNTLILGGRIPCTNIWCTEKPRFYNVHIDKNTVGPAFLFTAKTYKGGDLITRLPGGKQTFELSAGIVVGGRWAQYPHCVTKAEEGRRSFVVYLDYRGLMPNYPKD